MANTTVKDELVTLEKRYWQAMKDGNVEDALALTDFPCIVAGDHGVRSVDKESFKKMMTASAGRIREVKLDDAFEVRLLGADVAVVAYTVHEMLTLDGKPQELHAADSSTWVRRNGHWACAHHTETKLAT